MAGERPRRIVSWRHVVMAILGALLGVAGARLALTLRPRHGLPRTGVAQMQPVRGHASPRR